MTFYCCKYSNQEDHSAIHFQEILSTELGRRNDKFVTLLCIDPVFQNITVFESVLSI